MRRQFDDAWNGVTWAFEPSSNQWRMKRRHWLGYGLDQCPQRHGSCYNSLHPQIGGPGFVWPFQASQKQKTPANLSHFVHFCKPYRKRKNQTVRAFAFATASQNDGDSVNALSAKSMWVKYPHADGLQHDFSAGKSRKPVTTSYSVDCLADLCHFCRQNP